MKIDLLCAIITLVLNTTLTVFLLYKHNRDSERLLFAVYTLYYVFSSLIYISKREHILAFHTDPLSFESLSYGAFLTIIFFFFPLEVMFPNLKKRYLYIPLFIIPVLFTTYWNILLKNGMHLTYISNMSEILGNINDASIVLRLLFFSYILLYLIGCIIFMIWGHNRYMTKQIVRIYAYGAIPIMIIYIPIIFLGLGIKLYVLYSCYMIFYNITIAYLLLKPEKSPIQPICKDDTSYNNLTPEEKALLHKLNHLLETENLYRRSGLTLPELSQLLGTNRTKLSKLIRYKGFSTFQDYLNTYRLEEFKRLITSGEATKINEAAQMAGFGSKATVYRCFMSAYGISPSQYLKNNPT